MTKGLTVSFIGVQQAFFNPCWIISSWFFQSLGNHRSSWSDRTYRYQRVQALKDHQPDVEQEDYPSR
jgi:hypothetical protein